MFKWMFKSIMDVLVCYAFALALATIIRTVFSLGMHFRKTSYR